MDSARWELIKTICFAALERPDSERPQYVRDACVADELLRREVEGLLREYADDPDFLETPVLRLDDPSGDLDRTAGSPADQFVGLYRLVRPLGHGGMGDVYLAVQEAEDFRQSVAVKVIRPGLDTVEVLERFRLERQILAGLHHPNIARLLDGGATGDGRPFFVMEYIEGTPVDDFADRHRLSVRQRLELFQTICHAVQHAHQNLVVHRDIKPTNILVTEEGIPKLLDFGIGKVLGPGNSFGAAVHTRTNVRLLTPEYAAPEQVRGEPVTTATDVYGLGVVLYELLTGHHPYASGRESVQEIERAVCETEPNRPSARVTSEEIRTRRDGSTDTVTADEIGVCRGTDPYTLRRRLRGDLDNVVLMALRKEPNRRYPSAAALGEDVRRHLAGLPVAARPDTLGYRMSKFVHRHAWAVAAVAMAFLALVATTGVTLVQSARVARERDRALEERAKAVEVRGFLMELFGGTGADQAATDTLTARQLLDLQAARIDAVYVDQPALRAEMMGVLADGYERLGLFTTAEPWAHQALALRRETLGPDHPDVAASLNMVGWINHELGNAAEAVPYLEEAVAIRRAAGAAQRVELSRSLNDLGVVVESLGDYDRAETLYREALDIRTEAYGEGHRSVGITANNLAGVHFRRGDYATAAEMGTLSLRALRASVGPDHQRSTIAQSNLAVFQMRLGALDSAEQTLRDLLDRQTRIQGRNHPVTAFVMGSLGSVLTQLDRLDEAERLLRESLAIRETALGSNHPDVASSLHALGLALRDGERYAEAEDAFQRALAVWRDRYGASHAAVGTALADLAVVYEQTARPAEAERHYRRALRVWNDALGQEHPRLATLRATFARFLLTEDEPEEALALFGQSHQAAGKIGARSLGQDTRLGMAEAHLALGHWDLVDSLLTETLRRVDTGSDGDQIRERAARVREMLTRARRDAAN